MPLFHHGAIVAQSYVVKRKIGEGQFSEVYEVERNGTKEHFAMKIDRKRDVRTVKQELKVLRQLEGCKYVCSVHGKGDEDGRGYIIMDLLGKNLAEARRHDYGDKMPVPVAKVVASGLLRALESFHTEGYIHRDVKPANFAVSPPGEDATAGRWILIDFGLARRYVGEDGALLPERHDASFRGSTTYASINAHEDKDLGRRDDLWSWFYILVELIEGTLPWRADRDIPGEPSGVITGPRGAVAERKRDCIAHPEKLYAAQGNLAALSEVSAYINGLNFEEAPDYDVLHGLVDKLEPGAEGTPQDEAALHHASEAAAPASLENGKPRDVEEAPAPLSTAPHVTTSPATGRMERSRSPQPRRRSMSRGRRSASRSPTPQRRRRDRDSRRESDRDRERERDRDRDRDRHRERSRDRDRNRERERDRERDKGRVRENERDREKERRRDRERDWDSRHRSRSRDRPLERSVDKSRSPPPRTKKEDSSKSTAIIDVQRKYQNALRYVGMLRSGGISPEGAAAVQYLRSVQPTEALGIACLLIDELTTGLQGEQLAMLGPVLEELAGYAVASAAHCTTK